jgi:hypothetical protein
MRVEGSFCHLFNRRSTLSGVTVFMDNIGADDDMAHFPANRCHTSMCRNGGD